MLSRLQALLASSKAKKAIVIGGLIGILLLIIPEFFPKSTEKATASTADTFVRQTEERLTVLIGSMEGVGECRVMVTLDSGVEYVYATENRSNSDREEDVRDSDTRLTEREDNESAAIIIETDNGREGLLVTEIQPTVRGVVVACEGGNNEEVKSRVLEAVTVALNISAKRVCVTKLS